MNADQWTIVIFGVLVVLGRVHFTEQRIRQLEREVLNLRAWATLHDTSSTGAPFDRARMAANRQRIMERIAEE